MSATAEQLLSDLMDFGRAIWSAGNGQTIRPDMRTYGVQYVTPEEVQYIYLDADGGAPDPEAPVGWEYLIGFTSQYGYNGPVMHPSEYIGGRLAQYILETPGYYVAVMIDALVNADDDEPQSDSYNTDIVPVGWGVLHYIDGVA